MNKKIKILMFFIFFLFLIPSVHAEPAYEDEKCSDVINAVDEYEGIVNEIDGLSCESIMSDNTSNDFDIIGSCNELYTKKTYLLSKLFKINEDAGSCSSGRLDQIIKENEDVCSPVLDSTIKDISDTVMNIFYILAPFLVIIFGSLDFAKIVVSTNPKEIQKNRKNFIRRLIAMVLLFLTPAIVNFITSTINFSGYSLDGNVYSCKRPFNFSVGSWDVVYVPKTNTSGNKYKSGTITVNSQGTQAMLDAASQLFDKFKAEGWTYGSCGGSNIEKSINCSSKQLVCADLIAQVLYLGNIFTAEEINSTKYNGCCGLYHFLIEKGWIEITNYDDLQPGDVVFFGPQVYVDHGGNGYKYYSKHLLDGVHHREYEHTALYAGNNEWYDTGETSSIQSGGKITRNRRSWFGVGLRMP